MNMTIIKNFIKISLMSTALVIATSVSDVLVFIAYFAIPSELWYFYKKLTLTSQGFPEPFKQVLYLFVLFICCCGLTHLVMAFHPFFPVKSVHHVNFWMKFITAVVSLFTAYKLFVVIPRVLYYPIYTQGIERENLERQVHEHYLQENVNIFRQIRSYTEKLSSNPTSNLYAQMSAILFNQLKVENAIYLLKDENSDECFIIQSTPVELNCPTSSSFKKPSFNTGIGGKWWILYFDSGFFNHKGFIALHTKASQVLTQRKSLILDDETLPLFPLPETNVHVEVTIEDKPYFSDIILDVINHFETQLYQMISRQRTQELVNKLTEQNDALRKSRQESQIIAKQSRDWLSVMSHEMRTPLFAVESLSDLLLEKINKNENRDLYSSLFLISQSANHLTDIINNILDFSKLENGEYNLEVTEFDIQDVINEGVSINVRNEKRLYPQVSIFFETPCGTTFLGDALRIKQIVVNLLNNALKFTPDEGTVNVVVNNQSIDHDPTKTSKLVIEVSDTGIGINENDKHKIFKQFSQTDSSITRRFGGSGLGLSICKRLANLMNGDITFRPNSPIGTIFRCELLVETSNVAIKRPCIPEEALRWKLAVQDDNDLSLRCTISHLEQIGFKNIATIDNCLFSVDDYDHVFVNVRSKCILENIETWKEVIVQNINKVIVHTTPYMKSNIDISSKFELLGPIINKELISIVEELCFNKGLLIKEASSTKSDNKLNIHVLVAEDNAINRTVLKQMLTQMGVTADFAEDGLKALELFRTHGTAKYKIILMDIMMPIMDGYTSTREIRKISQNMNMPYIIALTANAFWEERVKATECGMNDFVTKPAKKAVLYETLRKAKIQNLN